MEAPANLVDWEAVGAALTTSNNEAHSGTSSGCVTNRTVEWNGVAQTLLGVLQTNRLYRISAWVRLGDWVNPWMFQYAHALDPEVTLFVNDYNVVSYNETDAYKQQIQDLLAEGAPVQAIGAQRHFGDVIDPLATESRLDSLAELGLPIWITEYDPVNTNESARAANLETLYRLAFSKPAVEGVLMWGFWAGSHWRGSNAAIVDLDWMLNAAGQHYRSLMDEWTTTNGTSGAGGAFEFRGIHGTYEVTLTPPDGEPTLRTITLEPGESTSVLTLTLDCPPMAGPATNPDPADGANGVTVTPTLTWSAGSNATSHQVFFGYRK